MKGKLTIKMEEKNIFKKSLLDEYRDFFRNNNPKSNSVIDFFVLWLFYNSYYSQNVEPKFDRDKAMIIMNDCNARKSFEENKNKFLESFSALPFTDGDEGSDYRAYLIDKKNNSKIRFDNDSNFGDYLTIIYAIRCNLFHGDKRDIDSNAPVIKWAYDTFRKILEESKLLV